MKQIAHKSNNVFGGRTLMNTFWGRWCCTYYWA